MPLERGDVGGAALPERGDVDRAALPERGDVDGAALPERGDVDRDATLERGVDSDPGGAVSDTESFSSRLRMITL